MKLFITTLTIIFTVQLQAQVNLITPSEDNYQLWVLAENNNTGITFESYHENDNALSGVVFNETISNWDCDAFSCAIKKTDIKTITLDEFNTNYRDETISFLSIKDKFASDPLNQCGHIENYLRERADKITYFVIEGNQVKVYLKAFCGVLNSNDH